MKKFKILSLVLALTLVCTSMSMVAFASTTTEQEITIDYSTFANYKSGTKNSNCTPSTGVTIDDRTDVVVFSSGENVHYTGSGIGTEPRVRLNGTTDVDTTSLGGIDWSTVDTLKIEGDIYIGDTDDGLAFRTLRLDSTGSATSGECYYFVIGGEAVTAATAVANAYPTGYTIVNKSLSVGWNTVTIEIGAKLSNSNYLKITVGGTDVTDATVITKKYKSGADDETLDSLPNTAYGFVGKENYCCLIPKSASANTSNPDRKIDVKLDDFTMKAISTATSTEPDTPVEPEVKGLTVDTLSAYYATQNNVLKSVAYAEVTSTLDEDKDVIIIVARYDANRNLLKAYQGTMTCKANATSKKTHQMNANIADGTKYTKAFLWYDLDNTLEPLAASDEKEYVAAE